MSYRIGWIPPLKMIFEIFKSYVKLNKFISTWTKVQISFDVWGRVYIYLPNSNEPPPVPFKVWIYMRGIVDFSTYMEYREYYSSNINDLHWNSY